MIAAIYARYSSDLQSERSIDDQIAACMTFAAQRGLPAPTMNFADAAISGASMATRPQLLALLDLVRARRISIIIAEAIDRLSRDQADLHLIRRACDANNVKLYTISDGEVSGMVAGLQGIMAEAFLKNLAQKTRRGMMGVAREGRIAGGLSFGYRAIDGRPGERTIDEAEAGIVRRIYASYLAGRSPYAIARSLNAEGVAGPRGRAWKVNTIAGDARIGDGILCNELYRGRIVFNRRRYQKNPETGRRSSFLNPPAEWLIVEKPELRILDDDTFEAAMAMRRGLGSTPLQNRRKRPQRLLSGILRCAACGGAFTIINRDRMACSNAIAGTGSCDVRQRLPAAVAERRVIEGLKRNLLSPDAIAAGVRGYQEQRKAMRGEENARRHEATRGIEEARRRASRIADQLIDTPSPTLRTKLAEAEAQVTAFEAELAAIPPASIVELHPNAADAYKAVVATLETALSADAAPEIRQAVRGLLERIEAAPDAGAPDGWSLVIYGQLATLLALANEKTPGVSAGGLPLISSAIPSTVGLGAGAYTGRYSATVRLVA